jgi:hypothetical protein
MTAAVYVAKRSLIAGHTAAVEYSIDLRVVEGGLRIGRKVGSTTQRSISDKTETLYFYGKATYQVTAIVFGSTERLALEEFLHSTEGQEGFTFSPYGTVATLGATLSARRSDGAYELERLDFTGATPAEDAMRVSFAIEAV